MRYILKPALGKGLVCRTDENDSDGIERAVAHVIPFYFLNALRVLLPPRLEGRGGYITAYLFTKLVLEQKEFFMLPSYDAAESKSSNISVPGYMSQTLSKLYFSL
jgi:hypothetical protein